MQAITTRSDAPRARIVTRRALEAGAFIAIAALVASGFAQRDANRIAPDEGTGYALGIAGVACMLLMQGYSLRKRVEWLAGVLPIGLWFRAHMILGVLGPALILLHCNFRATSINSLIAMACMAIMVASGVLGRFLHGRVHGGLNGERLRLDAMVDQLDLRRRMRTDDIPSHAFLDALRRPKPTLTGQIRVHVRLRRYLGGLDAASPLADCMRQLAVVSRLRIAERVFALWHVVHMPLVVMLAASVVLHVCVVHVY